VQKVALAGPLSGAGRRPTDSLVSIATIVTALSFLALLLSAVLSEAPVTWLFAAIFVACAVFLSILAARNGRAYVAFILPALTFYVLFVVFPTLEAFRVSLYQWNGMGEPTDFIGLQNFGNVLGSEDFYNAFGHNVLLFVSIFVLQNSIGLLLAVLLNGKPRFFEFYRAIIFSPVIISLVATGLMWQLIFGSNIGLLTPVLQGLGLDFLVRDWLGDDNLTFWLLVIVQFWQWMGLPMIIYLAGLQNVPEELTAAARIDGATEFQAFRHVTFPLLAPAFTVVTGLSFISMFKVFDIPFVMAGPGGSPDGTTDVLGLVIYRTAFGLGTTVGTSHQQGYAVAIGIYMFVIILVVATIQLVVLRRREVNL
jgi:raffinose/stachyose/melibiose transport system permease protein